MLDVTSCPNDLQHLLTAGCRFGEAAPDLCKHVRSLEHELDLSNRLATLGLADYLLTTVSLLLAHTRKEQKPTAPPTNRSTTLSPKKLEPLKEYIWEHLQHSIYIEELANLHGSSPAHFSRVFKKTTGSSPHQFVTSMRILKARTLLAKKQDLASVAFACGFADQAHFSRIFRQRTGFTPAYFLKSTT